MHDDHRKPGDPIPPCQELPVLRARSPQGKSADLEERLGKATGYTAPGYVEHFLPDREVNLAALNKALADVYGEPAFRLRNLDIEIDRDYWTQLCSDPWSGNIYRYSF